MTTTTEESRGHLMYTAYCKRVGFRSRLGESLPMFHDLDPVRRQAWIAGADSIWLEAAEPAASTSAHDRGMIAYAVYYDRVGRMSIYGERLPKFKDMDEDRRNAWIDAADVIWQLGTTGRAEI